MVPLARRTRTVKLCSFDARGKGPIQATLLYNQGGEREISEKKGDGLLVSYARATRGLGRPSLDARSM